VITLDHVTKIYTISREHQVIAVHDASLSIARSEFLLVTGRSGSGKTTLLNLAAGLTPPSAGKVLWESSGGAQESRTDDARQILDLWHLSDRQRSVLRNRQIGFVFQFPSLLPALTVLENVTLPTVLSTNGAGSGTLERAGELLHAVGLADKRNVYPRQLSAGQQQRVVIARALFNQPQVLLADEPTSDLDERTERDIMELFQELHTQTGVTIIMVTHTAELVGYGTRHVCMVEGRIEEEESKPKTGLP
jgi:ABC-type lipoprotein export system ATPase subunit